MEINSETENRTDLVRKERVAKDKKVKKLLQEKIEKSDDKLQSMTVIMLHYCAGLQHCMDQEEMERQKRMEQEQMQQEQAEQELTEPKLVEQGVCEQERTITVSQLEQCAVIEENDLQTENVEHCADEIKTDYANEKIEDDFCPDGIERDAFTCEIEAVPCAADDCSESSLDMQEKQDLDDEDDSFNYQELLETKRREEDVAAIADEKITIPKSVGSTSQTEFQPANYVEPLEVIAIEGTCSITETVGMSAPVSTCHLLDMEPDILLGQLPSNTIDIAMPQISTISAVDDTPFQEENEETADCGMPEIESTMNERVSASVALEEFCQDSGTSELCNLPHSSIETVVNEASVINASNSCENLTSDDCEDWTNTAQQKDAKP